MNNQRFRYKMIALLLTGLLVLAVVHGATTIPLTDASGSLRDAILRLTGQEVPSASPGPDASASPGLDAAASPGPDASASPELDAAASPSPEAMIPLSEALSNFFDASSSSANPAESVESPSPSP